MFLLRFYILQVEVGPGSSRKGAVLGVAPPALSIWLLPAQTTLSARPIDDGGSCKNRSCGVYFLPVGLLQFAALRAAGHSTVQAAVCAECHCTADHWHATQRSYISGIVQTPLATHSRARQVQSGVPGSPVAVRAGASLLGRRLPPRALCAQLTFQLAWCRQHSAVMATELLQPWDLACGTLFPDITSYTDCSDNS